MLDNSSHYWTLLTHYLFCLFLVALLSLTLNSVINNQKENRVRTNLEQTGSLVLKQVEYSP